MTTPVRVTPPEIDGVIEEIRVAMVRRRMTQHALADKVGEGDPWVHRRLTGRAEITVRDLYRMAAALGVSPRSLIPEEDVTVPQAPTFPTWPARRSLLPADRPIRIRHAFPEAA